MALQHVDRKENLLYLDNRGVRVTKLWLRIGNATYAIGNITSYSTAKGHPSFIGPALTGLTGLAAGLYGVDTAMWWVAGGGAFFLFIAVVWAMCLKPFYYLRIVSTGTESHPVKDPEKAYVDNILAAIHKAKVQRE